MNFDTYANLYYFSAVAVVVMASVLLHLIFRKKLNFKYSLAISLGLMLTTFTVVYVFMKKFNPAVYQSYNDWYHARKDTSYKQVTLDYAFLEASHKQVQQFINESDNFEDFLPKTQSLLAQIGDRINIDDKMRPIASVSILMSTFFAYGNPAPDHEKPGCLTRNVELKDDGTKKTDFQYLKATKIGCCTDFAYIFTKYLKWLNYEQRVVSIGGHVLNEFKVGEEWFTVDANTGLIANRPFIGDMDGVQVYYLPHFGMMDSPYFRPVLLAFRDYIDKVFVNQKFAQALFIEYLSAENYKPY